MNHPYDGEDRRKQERDDHDMLTRIDANLSNFMSRFDAHTKSDDEHLNRLYAKTGNLEKRVWMATGAIIVIEIVVRLWK